MRSLLVLLCVGLVGLILSGGPSPAEENFTTVPDNDPKMAAAIAKAQDTLDGFLALAENPPAGADLFVLKVGISDGSQTEHFWMNPFRREGDEFIGTIDNDPVHVKTVTAGSEYKFKRADVSDWGYRQNGKLHGYHTLRALFPYMSKEEVEHFKSVLAEP